MHNRGILARNVAIGSILVAAMAFGLAGTAFAAGTGDDPARTGDMLSPEETAQRAALEAESPAEGPGMSIIDPPYKYLYTPTHAQERSYWCGPATVQIIDDYLGVHASQSTIAQHMGTTAAGTDFSLVDDELRYRTGAPYYYYGGLTAAGFSSKVQDTILNHLQPVATDVNIVASIWPNYMFDHSGHIIPIEAFDWRSMKLRLNDPYNEGAWRPGGGTTLGHRTYSKSTVWDGVDRHFRSAVVCAP